jgi:hypothetical protein
MAGGARDGTEDDGSAVLGNEVEQDREGWWVVLTVGFAGEVVRRRIGPYLTQRAAHTAATLIRRAADRENPPPQGF